MSEPFVGEIRMFAGNFAPRGWAFCDGQLIAVSTNDALFSLYGTIYGGDGRTTFGLPDLRGRIPLHFGAGPGLTNRPIGQKGGQEQVVLNQTQVPTHKHSMQGSGDNGTSTSPAGLVLAKDTDDPGHPEYFNNTPANTTNADMNQSDIALAGGNQGHNNIMPFICINYICSLFGIYPSRN